MDVERGPRRLQITSSRAIAEAVLGLTLGLIVLPAAPAWAHGVIESAHPAQGSTVAEPPRELSVHLAEPAAPGSTLVVTDGCGERVGDEGRIEGQMFTLPIQDGRPGRWNVKVRSISSVDGHLVRESFSFKVRGKKDCSPEESPSNNDDDEVELGAPQPPIQNDESSFPVVPFALGTVVLIGLAIALRRSSGRP